MKRLVFDIEGNGLLDEVTTIHCIVSGDPETGEILEYGPGQIEDGLRALMAADQLIAHNGWGYDLPAIKKLHPWFHYRDHFDTLTASRLVFANVREKDFALQKRGKLPGNLIGSHKLEAWGCRLGDYKGDFRGPWDKWSPEMQQYCVQDVRVTMKLLKHIESTGYANVAMWLEQSLAPILIEQEQFGFPFKEQQAAELYAELSGKREVMRQRLLEAVDPWYSPVYKNGRVDVFTPKSGNSTTGYVAGAPFTRVKLNHFNPASDQMVINRLVALYGWEPDEFTDNGQPKADEDTLKGLPYPIIEDLLQFKMLDKRCSQLAEGKTAWLKMVRNGKIHHYVNPMGTVTGRASHSGPNLGQVPAGNSPYGPECRALFHPEDGWVQVGADLSGLELRCLGHFMARWDGGDYVKVILEGDIHTVNQQAAGLPTRQAAKTFIYAFLYGAGDTLIGKTIGKGARAGKKIKAQFLAGLPALGALKQAVEEAARRGYLVGIDGRRIYIRSAHSALNFLLQGAGAAVSKAWIILAHQKLKEAGFVSGTHFKQMAWVHDELQFQTKPEVAHDIGNILVESAREVTDFFKLRAPIDAEYKVGNSWAECH